MVIRNITQNDYRPMTTQGKEAVNIGLKQLSYFS